MAACVAIEVADDGTVSVGAIPPGQYGDAMQPAGSVDEALAMAGEILQQGPGEQQQAAEAGFASAYEGEPTA